MTDNMHLYDENYRYTFDASLLDEIVQKLLKKTFDEYIETGYSPREISQIMQAAVNSLELDVVLETQLPIEKMMAEKMQKAEVGDGIDRVDVPPTRGGTG